MSTLNMHVFNPRRQNIARKNILLKVKFHYAIQVADLVADRYEPACLPPAFDPKSRKLVADVRELVESQVGNQVCDQVCVSATWIA